jgi:hypothetical protein
VTSGERQVVMPTEKRARFDMIETQLCHEFLCPAVIVPESIWMEQDWARGNVEPLRPAQGPADFKGGVPSFPQPCVEGRVCQVVRFAHPGARISPVSGRVESSRSRVPSDAR